jgi:hypothetical protein
MLMLVVAVEEEDKLEEVEPAHRARDEVDVVELEDLADAGEALVDSGEERSARRERGRRRVRSTRWCRTRRSVIGKGKAEMMKRCMVRDDIVKVGSRAQIWLMYVGQVVGDLLSSFRDVR